MKKYIRSAVASLLVLVIVLTTYLPTFAVSKDANGQPTKYSSQYNSGDRDVVATTLNGTSALTYYNNYSYDKLSTYSKDQLISTLRTLMTSTHSYKSTYNDCHYKADRTDCENEDGRVSLIYTSYSATMEQWNGWNREHVWPQSLGGGNTTGGGADLHHIRPSDAVVNSTRGNEKYGNVSGGKSVYGKNPCPYTGTASKDWLGGELGGGYFEPLDNVKGDVARICLYVWVRWGSAWGADSITEVFQSVDVLLEWMLLDPVDTWELGRNEVVQDSQGNRNVFIDYPEYAWLIFGREVPADLVSPSGEAANGGSTHSHSYTSSVTTQPTCTSTGVKTYTCSCGASYTETVAKKNHSYSNGVCTVCGASDGSVPACTHTTTVVKNAVSATCSTEGYTGDTYCQSCDVKLSTGSAISATGNHVYGDWELQSDGTYEKHCDTCDSIVIMNLNDLIAYIDDEAEKILLLLALGVNNSIVLDTLGK